MRLTTVRQNMCLVSLVYCINKDITVNECFRRRPLSCMITQLCLEHGMPTDYSYEFFTMLELGVYLKDTSVVSLLIHYGANVDVDTGYPIRHAYMTGDDMFDILLAAGANVNLCPGYARTALGTAIAYSSALAVSKLLAAGAHITYFAAECCTGIDRDEKIKLIEEYN